MSFACKVMSQPVAGSLQSKERSGHVHACLLAPPCIDCMAAGSWLPTRVGIGKVDRLLLTSRCLGPGPCLCPSPWSLPL